MNLTSSSIGLWIHLYFNNKMYQLKTTRGVQNINKRTQIPNTHK